MIIEKTMNREYLSNTYLVADKPGGHAVLIDTGGPTGPILETIEALRLTVSHVLCTHHHIDHVSHNADYKSRFGCPVCGHTAESGLFGVTFYSMFSHKERGRKHIYFCKTLPCWLRGAPELLEVFEEKLGVKADSGEITEDGQFSIERAECIGLCEMAPAILVEDERYGNITPEMVDEILEELRK